MNPILRTASLVTLLANLPCLLLAQATVNPSAARDDDEVANLDQVVVTGRVGVDVRTKAQTSYAITDVSGEQLRLQSPMGLAEALKSVPGFWVEASGGEAGANIRARGIPLEGYSTLGLEEDGLPVQHDAGLGFLNADQSFRIDETIERFEVVRGGPSSIFTSNAPGGVVNMITRKGGDTPEGIVKYEIGDFGRHRVDVWHGGPVGDWRYGVGGFYRVDDGVRDPGWRANEGGQIRLSLAREFERGRVDANIKHFDDRVIFYLGIPLTFDTDGDPAEVPGFDANYGTFSGPETAHAVLRSAKGDYVFDQTQGMHVELTQFTLNVDYDLGGGWRLNNGFRYRTSDTLRDGLFPSSLTAGPTFLANRRAALLAANPGATDVQLRYVTSPATVFDPVGQNGNGLVAEVALRSVDVPLDEWIDDLRVAKKVTAGTQSHDVAIGAYFARVEETFKRYSATAITDVRDNARLLNLVAVDAAGQVVGAATENGISRYGSEFANGTGESETWAFYGSDEWQVTRQLRIDAGLRWERVTTSGLSERVAAQNLNQSPTPADDNALSGTGVFDAFDRSFDDIGWTLGADWQFTPRSGVFARYTPTIRLPNVSSFIASPTATPVIQEIDLWETGVKFVTQPFDVYATLFYTEFANFGFSETVFNPATGGFTTRTEFTTTEAYGLELETNIRPVRWFDVNVSATVQKPEFGTFKFNQLVNNVLVPVDYTGNRLPRVPEVSFRVQPGVTLLGGALRAQVGLEYYGNRYSDAANSVVIPNYMVLNFNARYALTRQLTLYVYAENLTNEIGLTEGNPRAGQFQSGDAGARYYFARPILGRSLRTALTYRF